MINKRESEINEFLVKSAKAEDKRHSLRKLYDAFIHSLKVFRERFSPIR